MAPRYKFNGFIFGALLIIFQSSFSVQEVLQAFKVINGSNMMVDAKYIIPAYTISYTHLVSMEIPQAYITSWMPGTHGNAIGSLGRNESHPLPTWVRIKFDKKVSESFVTEFFKAFGITSKLFKPRDMCSIRHLRHGKFKDEFVITIGPYYTKKKIEVFVEKTNIFIAKQLAKKSSDSIRN